MADAGSTQSLDGVSGDPQPREALMPGDRVDGTYRVERLLGEGGAGAVYLVRHEGLGDARFALKVLREGAGRSTEALAREGRLAARVRSAHVVKVAAIGRLPRRAPYLVMEFVDGQTLDELLAGRALSTSESIECARQLCLALEASHAEGLLHGDVSLRNLFCSCKPDGSLHLQLGDFGLARRLEKRPDATMSIETDSLRGTPRFTAPETIAGDELVDERADLFAVGVVLYRLLGGAFPFDGESARAILTAILRGSPVPLESRRPGLGPIAGVTMRCLELDPTLRYRTARELREAIERAASVDRGDSSALVEPSASSELVARSDSRALVDPNASSELDTRNDSSTLVERAQPEAADRHAALAKSRSWRAVVVGVAVVTSLAVALFAAKRFRERSTIPLAANLACPDTTGPATEGDGQLAHAVAVATCARIGAALDLDWGGGEGASTIATRMERAPSGGFRLRAEAAGRVVEAEGSSPLAAATELAKAFVSRARMSPMDPSEVRRWGGADAASAVAVRALWRRRTALIIDDYVGEPRAVLALDPGSPFAQLLLFQVERDPVLRKRARDEVLAHIDRLPEVRAAAVRAYLAALDHPEAPDAALDDLRRAFATTPDDIDVGVLYADALVAARRRETAAAVAEALHARAPRRSLLAVHLALYVDPATPEDTERFLGWELDALPELRGLTDQVEALLEVGHVDEADAANAFAARLGVSEVARFIPEAMVALAVGDPARIDQTARRQLADTRSWAQSVAERMRVAGLLVTGRVTAAGTSLRAQIGGARASGNTARALRLGAELLRLSRLAGVAAPSEDDLAWMDRALDPGTTERRTEAFARAEWLLARDRAGAPRDEICRASDALDHELRRRAGADGLALLAARLHTLPLLRRCHSESEANALWRSAPAAPLEDRSSVAFDAALSLEAAGKPREAEAAYTLAASPSDLVSHAFDSNAARLRLSDALGAAGRSAESAPLVEHLDRSWSVADPGLRDRVRALR